MAEREPHAPKISPPRLLARQIADETEAAHGCTIKVHRFGDTAGVWDGDRPGQVLSNLLANAAVHGKSDGAIVVQLDGRAPGAMHLLIRNDGRIPADLLPEIFEPFRGSKYQRGTARGLGLGLYITQEIVLAHGGVIDVTSDDDGTAFQIQLPREARTSRPGLHLES